QIRLNVNSNRSPLRLNSIWSCYYIANISITIGSCILFTQLVTDLFIRPDVGQCSNTFKKGGSIYTRKMADEIFMFALTCGVFVVFTAILFGSRVKRKSAELKIGETTNT
ncbi:MAG: hypothetical protein WA395_05685, partial [Nitrososphaeraceae archaeon]